MSNKILEVKNLDFSYKDKKILNNINLDFKKGKFIGITGKNGSGKSTFAKLIAGLERPHSGGVFFESKEITEESIHDIRPYISMVFQNPNNQIIASKVIDDLAFGLENLGLSRPKMIERIYETSRKLGIEHLLNKNPEELSGGQKQIVAIGGILVFNPKIIILDEITSMLDLHSKKKVFDLIKTLKNEHTIIMISHDSKELAHTDRVIIFNNGKVEEDLKPFDLFTNNSLLDKYDLEKPFDYKLFEKFPEKCERLGVCIGNKNR